MEAAAGLAVIPCDLPAGMNAVEYTFATAAANGMTVVRAFAHGVNNTLPLQTEPGTESVCVLQIAYSIVEGILLNLAVNRCLQRDGV